MQQNDSAPGADAPKQLVCPRYEVIHRYIQLARRPLTNLEQRAFLYLLDLDADERFAHSEREGECICLQILPDIVQALDPDPVDCQVSERSLEDLSYQSQRYHTERIGKHQGIVLKPKTKREHTSALRILARKHVKDVDLLVRELLSRPRPEYPSDRAMLEGELPQLLELARLVVKKRSPRTITWRDMRVHMEASFAQAMAQLADLERTMVTWGAAGT